MIYGDKLFKICQRRTVGWRIHSETDLVKDLKLIGDDAFTNLSAFYLARNSM